MESKTDAEIRPFFPGSIFNLKLEMKKIKINPLYNKKNHTLHFIMLV